MLGATGSAVVEVKLDLALASELGEVPLGGGAADSGLWRLCDRPDLAVGAAFRDGVLDQAPVLVA